MAREQEAVDKTVELLSNMASCNVTQIETSSDTTVYTCVVLDGRIKGTGIFEFVLMHSMLLCKYFRP